MGSSLRDQLLQAGLIDAKKAREAGREQHRQRRAEARDPAAAAAAAAAAERKRQAEQQAIDEKSRRDEELNRRRQEEQARKARKAEVRQLVQQHRVARPEDSELLYNFVDGKRIRRLAVDAGLRAKLVSGQLGIIRNEGRYELVAADVAQRIAERDPHALVSLAQPTAAPDDNDPYKDYVVPDDLIW